MTATKDKISIREYKPEDRADLIELLRLNIPVYFDPSELADFLRYLDNAIESFFVAEIKNEIIGCGGVNYFIHDNTARLSWDIIHPQFQGKGIGSALAEYRFNIIKENPNISTVVVRTTQWVFPFYEKLGFRIKSISKDYWAKGYDMYYMEKKA